MQNLQNIPGDTDLDIPFPDEDVTNDEKHNESEDSHYPPDKIPGAAVEEPHSEAAPINENPPEKRQIMSNFIA